MGETAPAGNLRQMLVLQGQAVAVDHAVGLVVCAVILERRDQRLAASGIARDRVDRHRIVGRDQPARDQRMEHCNRRYRIAARIADPFRGPHHITMAGFVFVEPISPAFDGPVGGRRIDHRRVALDHGDGFPRRIIRQAKDRYIGLVERVPTRCGILASHLTQLDKRHISARGEPFIYLQAGRSGLTVDENLCGHNGKDVAPLDANGKGAIAPSRRSFPTIPLESLETAVCIT